MIIPLKTLFCLNAKTTSEKQQQSEKEQPRKKSFL